MFDQNRIYYVYGYKRSKKSKRGDAGTYSYIGKGKNKRAYEKSHRIKPPSDPTNIVFFSIGMNEADAFQLETLLICLYGRIDLGTGCLHNRIDGAGSGYSGRVVSEETRRKISEYNKANGVRPPSRKGCKMPADYCARLSERMREKPNLPRGVPAWNRGMKGHYTTKAKGRKLSPEHCYNLSQSHMGHKRSLESRQKQSSSQMGHVSAMKGKKHTAEAKERIRQAHLGKKCPGRIISAQRRAKTSATLKGKPWSEARRAAHLLSKPAPETS